MTDRQPRPLWPLLNATLIGLPVLYVLSIGPAVWISFHTSSPDWASAGTDWLYQPLEFALRNGPEPFQDFMWWYLDLWGWKLIR